MCRLGIRVCRSLNTRSRFRRWENPCPIRSESLSRSWRLSLPLCVFFLAGAILSTVDYKMRMSVVTHTYPPRLIPQCSNSTSLQISSFITTRRSFHAISISVNRTPSFSSLKSHHHRHVVFLLSYILAQSHLRLILPHYIFPRHRHPLSRAKERRRRRSRKRRRNLFTHHIAPPMTNWMFVCPQEQHHSQILCQAEWSVYSSGGNSLLNSHQVCALGLIINWLINLSLPSPSPDSISLKRRLEEIAEDVLDSDDNVLIFLPTKHSISNLLLFQVSKRSRSSGSSSSVSSDRSIVSLELMHSCPACDAFFPTRQSLRQHGQDAQSNEACSVAVEYAFE